MTYCWERGERWTATHKEHRDMNLRLRFVVLLHLARVFDHFEIAFMDNQAKVTGVFSLLDSETVS